MKALYDILYANTQAELITAVNDYFFTQADGWIPLGAPFLDYDRWCQAVWKPGTTD